MPDKASGIIAKLRFVDITDCDDAMLEAVRTLRNHCEIRRFMYSTHEISQREHANWVARLRGAHNRRAYAVQADDAIAGTVNWSAAEQERGRLHWGFYVNPQMTGRGIGTAMLTQFLGMLFAGPQTDCIIGEALEDNGASQALHKRLGFVEQGRRNVERDGGQTIQAVRFVLTRRDWLENLSAEQQGK